MILRLQIEDSLYEMFERRATEAARSTGRATIAPEELIVSLLDRCKNIDPMRRPFVLQSTVKEDLENMLHTPIKDGDTLVAAVRDLKDLQIGKIHVDLTPGQWKVLKSFATQHDMELNELVTMVAERTVQHLFDGGLAFAGYSRVL